MRKSKGIIAQKRFVALTPTYGGITVIMLHELETSDVENGRVRLVLMVKSHVQKGVKPLVELSIVRRMSLIACSLI